MGTRNLTVVIEGEKPRVAQYCQWDGYPSGVGADICKFIQSTDMEKFKEKVREVKFATEKEIEDLWVEAGAERGATSVPCDVSDKFKEMYPEFHRDTGPGVLQLINEDKVKLLDNKIEFAGDSLFCEWAYVLDLDNEVLEVYKGFNKNEPKGRFADMETRHNDYGPITILAEIPFSSCTEQTIEAFGFLA